MRRVDPQRSLPATLYWLERHGLVRRHVAVNTVEHETRWAVVEA
jgi:hypothetical protein